MVSSSVSGTPSQVSAEWLASDAEAAGLSSEDIARDLSAFVADPLATDPPETPMLRLRLGRIEFANWSSGGATWPGRNPSSIFVVDGAYSGDRPWHMAPRSGTDGDEDEDSESPLAIIDPVFELDDAEAGFAPSNVAVSKAGDELDALTAFVAAAREDSWKIAFGDAD